ncbi:protease [Streptomyces sp. Qhu-G9]|uniref:protease n=1 Tax=Streptomyces sp. Qhu-G9 TaxID=3452799 RepID=UPI0022AC23F0|nr:protease [Streptomyces aurantiacus]WAU79436.1 protease [Streptomyces aurantiacus]
MTKFLLVLHVLVAIIAIGPVTVAASMFPPGARRALADPGDPRATETVRLLHRICRVYAAIGIAVPVLGFATALSMGVLDDAWLVVSMVLTGIAAAVLLALVLPRQEEILEAVESAGAAAPTGTVESVESVESVGTVESVGPPGAAEAAGSSSQPPSMSTSPSMSPSPPQSPSVAVGANPRATVQLAMFTGIFNLLWATVTILMIVRPGSTTGA